MLNSIHISEKGIIPKYAFLYIALFLVVLSCKTKQSNHPFASFNRIIEVEEGTYPINNDFALYQPQELLMNDSLLIVLDIRDANNFLKIYDKKEFSLISSWGVIGKGPNEFLGPALLKKSPNGQSLWFMDMPKSTLYCLDFDELLSNNETVEPTLMVIIPPEFMPFWSYLITPDNAIIIPNGGGTNALISIIDFDGNLLKTAGESHDDHDGTPMSNFFYSSVIATSPFSGSIALFFKYHDTILLGNTESNTTTETNGLNYVKQKVNIHSSGNVIIDYFAFSGVKAHEKYLFAQYLGRKRSNSPLYSDEILVFTWKLEPIAVLKLPNPIIDFDMSEGEIYAIMADSEDFSHLENPIQKFRIELDDE